MINSIDSDYLVDCFNKRLDALDDEAMRAYWAGRVDGHCLQNAISLDDLILFAYRQGFNVDWKTAMEVVAARQS